MDSLTALPEDLGVVTLDSRTYWTLGRLDSLMNDTDIEQLDGDSLLDMVYELRERNEQLTEQLARVNYERCEDQSELARHHGAFLSVSDFARRVSVIAAERRVDGKPVTEGYALAQVGSLARDIRNIVG